MRSGLLTRRLRSVPLHQIRTVDLTASPLHRLLGVTVLRAGTAGSGRAPASSPGGPAGGRGRAAARELLARAATGAVAEDPVLARINWRWLRYAPLTFWVVGGVFVAGGSAYRALHEMGIEPWKIGFVRRAFEEFGNGMLWLTLPAALLAVIALGSVGALVLYVENWWSYRLEWADAGTLRVHRGLLTTRSVTIERARLRGVVLREPLLLRAGGGATVRAVAGGLGNKEENRKRSGLLPPAPRREAVRVAGGTLRTPFPDPEVTGRQIDGDRHLVRHPGPRCAGGGRAGCCSPCCRSARCWPVSGRRSPLLLHAAWIYAVLATPAVLWLARDAYRNLGHRIVGEHLVVRAGTFSRDTLVLRREAVAAWTFTTSPFTRRAGLVTLTAAVAAGEEGYRVPDLAQGAAAGFAATAAPGILDEFLTRPVGHGDRTPST
ncbi:PH domain-containing protein [Streptomyces albulus]|nr:PH domain-containing protein [Streptomyces noursei]